MKLKIFLFGLAIIGTAFVAMLPGIILNLAGSPITGEVSAVEMMFDELNNSFGDYEGVSEITQSTKKSLSILGSIPMFLFIIGLIIAIAGLFIPDY